MRVRLFANSIASICEFPSVLFANDFSAPKEETKIRWAMLAPFGDWPNKQGMQRVTKEDAQVIVNEFEKPTNVLKRKVGIPFYIGHPDHPDFKERYKDTKAYGRIKEMEVRDDGLWAGIKFNGEGEQLIADEAFDGHSVNWFLKPDPKQKGIWRPFKVKSAGFTNEPNLPVPPITTANEAQGTIFKRLATLRLFANQSEKEADAPMQAAAKAANTDEENMVNVRYKKMAAMRNCKTASNEVAMDDVRQQLQAQMLTNPKFKKTRKNGSGMELSCNPWITDLFAPEGTEGWSLVASLGDDKYYRANFALSDGSATLADEEPVEVQRSVSFKPVKKTA